MPRPKQLPKRLPPMTKELVKILTSLNNLIPTFARMERSHLAIDMARKALDFDIETETRKAKTPAEPVPGQEPLPQQPTRTRKKKVDLDAMPPDTEPEPGAGLEVIPEIVIVCIGGCGKTTEGMTLENKSGEFLQVEESLIPEWTCAECLAKRGQEPVGDAEQPGETEQPGDAEQPGDSEQPGDAEQPDTLADKPYRRKRK